MKINYYKNEMLIQGKRVSLFYTLVFLIGFCFLPNMLLAQWETVGTSTISGSESSLAFDGEIPYVAFAEVVSGVNIGISVMKYECGNWEYIGSPGFSNGASNQPNITIYNGTPYVGYNGNSNKFEVMKFDGINWVLVGNAGISIGSARYCKILFQGSTLYAAYSDWGLNKKVVVKKFDGTNWINVGTPGFNADESLSISLAFDGTTPYVGFSERASTFYLGKVMKYDGTNWVAVGTINTPGVATFFSSLVIYNGFPYFAQATSATGATGSEYLANVQRFDGTNWNYIGNTQFSTAGIYSGIKMAFDKNGNAFVAYNMLTSGERYLEVRKLNGTNWDLVGTSAFSAGTFHGGFGVLDLTPYIISSNPLSSFHLQLHRYPVCDCSVTQPIAKDEGTYESKCTQVIGNWKHYCSIGNQLLLSLNVGTSGAVVADNEVKLKITSPLATYYQQNCGVTPACFINSPDGTVVFNRSWDVNPTTPPTSGNVGVKFYFSEEDYDAVNDELDVQEQSPLSSKEEMWFYKVTNNALGQFPTIPNIQASDIVVIKNDASTSAIDQWVLETKTSGSEYAAEFLVSSFSGGGGGGSNKGLLPLPVELVYFNAYAKTYEVQLKWATASETNNEGFEIQKSTNGISWEKIGFVRGQGNNNSLSNYSFIDENPNEGINYYRLKQIDFDRKFNFTPIQSVDMEGKDAKDISIFPNPIVENLNITNSKGTALIQDATGRVVMKTNLPEDGINTINVRQLEAGIYHLLIIKATGDRITRRFMKK